MFEPTWQSIYVHALKTGCVVLAPRGHAPRNRRHIGWVACFLNEHGFLLPFYAAAIYVAHTLEQWPVVRVTECWGWRLFKSACCVKSPMPHTFTAMVAYALCKMNFQPFIIFFSLAYLYSSTVKCRCNRR